MLLPIFNPNHFLNPTPICRWSKEVTFQEFLKLGIKRKNFSFFTLPPPAFFVTCFIFNGLRNGQLRLSDCLNTLFNMIHRTEWLSYIDTLGRR